VTAQAYQSLITPFAGAALGAATDGPRSIEAGQDPEDVLRCGSGVVAELDGEPPRSHRPTEALPLPAFVTGNQAAYCPAARKATICMTQVPFCGAVAL